MLLTPSPRNPIETTILKQGWVEYVPINRLWTSKQNQDRKLDRTFPGHPFLGINQDPGSGPQDVICIKLPNKIHQVSWCKIHTMTMWQYPAQQPHPTKMTIPILSPKNARAKSSWYWVPSTRGMCWCRWIYRRGIMLNFKKSAVNRESNVIKHFLRDQNSCKTDPWNWHIYLHLPWKPTIPVYNIHTRIQWVAENSLNNFGCCTECLCWKLESSKAWSVIQTSPRNN